MQPYSFRPLLDQEVIAKLSEMDMLVSDLERANSRIATVERRNVFPFNYVHSQVPLVMILGTIAR